MVAILTICIYFQLDAKLPFPSPYAQAIFYHAYPREDGDISPQEVSNCFYREPRVIDMYCQNSIIIFIQRGYLLLLLNKNRFFSFLFLVTHIHLHKITIVHHVLSSRQKIYMLLPILFSLQVVLPKKNKGILLLYLLPSSFT